MKVPGPTFCFLLMTIVLWSTAWATNSRFCSMHLPRALVAICGVRKRGAPPLDTDSTHALLSSARSKRTPLERYRRAMESIWQLHSDILKRGLAPIHVMADICCRRGCSLDDLLETCQ